MAIFAGNVQSGRRNPDRLQARRACTEVTNAPAGLLTETMKSTLLTILLAALIVAGFYIGKKLYLRPKNITGDAAPPITGTLMNGQPFALDQLKGRYVLIEFWGSWCGPCRVEHPSLVDFYREFGPKTYRDATGLDILSVGIEQSPARWQQAIIDDGMTWPYHILTMSSFDDPIVKAYTVKQIPTRFLVNPEGLIMAVDPSIEDLRRILGERVQA